MRSIQIGILILFLNLMGFQSTAVARGGDLIGNGGSFSDLRFIEISYEFLEALKRAKNSTLDQGFPFIETTQLSELLTHVNIEQTHSSLDLGPNEERHGVNYPQRNLILYDRVTFDNSSKDHQDIFVVHELLPLLGISDPFYRISRPLVEFLKSKAYWTATNLSAQKVHYEDILESYHKDQTKKGFHPSVALQLCQKAKAIYSYEYYFVYCDFIEKKHGEFVAYTIHQDAFVREDLAASSGRPVSRQILEKDIRQDHSFEQTSSYALVVYGLGRRDELSWRVLVTTRTNSNSFYQVNFATRMEALRSCRTYLRNYASSQSIRYHAAVCRTAMEFSISGSRYYFEVLTQNPLTE